MPTALSITIANVGQAPLLLTGADLTLVQGERPLPTPEIDALASPLAAGERRTLTLTVSLPAGPRAALRVTLGSQTYQITLDERG